MDWIHPQLIPLKSLSLSHNHVTVVISNWRISNFVSWLPGGVSPPSKLMHAIVLFFLHFIPSLLQTISRLCIFFFFFRINLPFWSDNWIWFSADIQLSVKLVVGCFFITLNTWIEKWVNILMFLNKAKDSLDFATLHTLCYKPIPPYFCLLRCGAKWFPPIYTYISTFVCFTEKSSNTKKGRENTNRHVKTYVLKFQDLTDLKIKQ